MGHDDDDDFETYESHSKRPPPPTSSVGMMKPVYVEEAEDDLKVKDVGEILSKADRSHLEDIDEENLGENFEDTPWFPPSLEKALEYRMKHMYKLGNTPLRHIKILDAPDLGEGISLYFQFTKSMAVYMLVCTILSIPLLVFCFFGSGMPAQDQDALMLYRFTLGNIGYDRSSVTYSEDAACKSTFAGYNGTCIGLGSYELPLDTASSIITTMEFLQVFAFFIVIWYLNSKTTKLKKKNEFQNCSISDYTVMVRGIPTDTTAEQLISHFSNLYPLDKPDWRNRPMVEGARPVQEVENSGNAVYKGTWIAECIVHKKIGSFISAFKSKQDIMERLFRSRAQMKMYSDNTPHGKGPNPSKYARAERNMIKAASTLDVIAEKELKRQNIKLKELDPNAPVSHIKDPQHNIEADAVAGFITFEYCESMARCVEDYGHYSRFPWSLCYPPALKFRGSQIKIRKAPEPDSMVWENLEVSYFSKVFLRFRTFFVTLCLLLVGFVVILQSTIYKAKFNSKIPKLSNCFSTIPELFSANMSSTYSYSNLRFTRPTSALERVSLDNQCSSIYPNTFFAEYANKGDLTQLVGNFSLSACSANGLCPYYGEDPFCPCLSTSSTTSCYAHTCSSSPSDCAFTAGTLGACYCMSILLDTLQASSVSVAYAKIKAASTEGTCNQFFINYTSSIGFTYLAIFVTVLVNRYLLYFLKILSKMESHASIDAEVGSTVIKIFSSTYFNMAILALIAAGRVDGLPSILQTAHILQGSYKDFDTSWYGNIGTYFILTFFIQIISRLIGSLIPIFVIGPLKRSCIYPFVSSQTSESVVRQHDVNKLEVGPVFDATTNQAQLLSLLFFTMTYAPGLPIMLPLCAMACFFIFLIDKRLLCRYNEKPPRIGDEIMRKVIRSLPFAALIRLGFACWMYGYPSILSGNLQNTSASLSVGPISIALSSSSYSTFLDGLSTFASGQSPSIAFLIKRIGQTNIFPLFALFVLILVSLLIHYLWDKLPVFWLLKFLQWALYACRRSNKVGPESQLPTNGGNSITGFEIQQLNHPLRQEVSPYTGNYFKYLRDKREIPNSCLKMCAYGRDIELSSTEIEEGWEIADRGDYIIKVKPWRITASIGGVTRTRGEHKRTYEVIGDVGCNTYSLDRIPAYKLAVQGLKQGTGSLMEYEASKKEPQKSLVDKYNERKSKGKQPKGGDVWNNPDIDVENQVVDGKKSSKPKPKQTTKEKNQNMGNIYASHGAEDDDDEDESESDDEEDGNGGKDDDDDDSDSDSDGSGLV